jgi:hypothetical protein
MYNPAPVVIDHEEAVENPEGQRGYALSTLANSCV